MHSNAVFLIVQLAYFISSKCSTIFPVKCDTIFVLLLFHVFITAHTIGHIM